MKRVLPRWLPLPHLTLVVIAVVNLAVAFIFDAPNWVTAPCAFAVGAAFWYIADSRLIYRLTQTFAEQHRQDRAEVEFAWQSVRKAVESTVAAMHSDHEVEVTVEWRDQGRMN